MKRFGIGGSVATAAGAVAVLAWSPQGLPVAEYVMSADRAYVVMNPEPVPVANVRHVEWSPSGRYLMMIQETPALSPAQTVDIMVGRARPKPVFRLLSFDRTNRNLRDHGPIGNLFGGDEFVDFRVKATDYRSPWTWFEGADFCYSLNDVESRQENGYVDDDVSLRRFDLERGTLQVHKLVPASPEGFVGIYPSPAAPALLEIHTIPIGTRYQTRVRTFDARGRHTALADLGEGIPRFRNWIGDGSIAKLELRVLEGRTVKSSRTVYFDVLKGQTVVIASDPAEFRPRSTPPPVEIRMTASTTVAGVVRVDHRAVWLSANGPSDNPAVLLSSDADRAALTPKMDYVAVLNRGIVTVRAIAILNRSAMEEALRSQAVLAVKEIGLGILMYAADYDDEFPHPDRLGENAVDPYLRDIGWMRNFNYTFRGGPMTNPAQTMLGFIPGPGGYAAVFADGHAEWKIGPPPKGG